MPIVIRHGAPDLWAYAEGTAYAEHEKARRRAESIEAAMGGLMELAGAAVKRGIKDNQAREFEEAQDSSAAREAGERPETDEERQKWEAGDPLDALLRKRASQGDQDAKDLIKQRAQERREAAAQREREADNAARDREAEARDRRWRADFKRKTQQDKAANLQRRKTEGRLARTETRLAEVAEATMARQNAEQQDKTAAKARDLEMFQTATLAAMQKWGPVLPGWVQLGLHKIRKGGNLTGPELVAIGMPSTGQGSEFERAASVMQGAGDIGPLSEMAMQRGSRTDPITQEPVDTGPTENSLKARAAVHDFIAQANPAALRASLPKITDPTLRQAALDRLKVQTAETLAAIYEQITPETTDAQLMQWLQQAGIPWAEFEAYAARR